jgi:hypothetical protein
MLVADAIYAAAWRGPDRPTASDRSIARARSTIRRFLEELPGEMTVSDLRAEMKQPE